ncbi:MAG: AGE family epimerase/isomerase [Rikenellaceae bacterium]
MTNQQISYLKECSALYKSELSGNILPFWLKYGLDKENGGVYTCIDKDGTLMDTTKSVWFQGRFAYICALTYNEVEKNSDYLDAAKSAIDFIEAHCFDSDGHMFFEVTKEGNPVRKRRYVFSECFAAIAFSEYSIASGDEDYAKKALFLFKRMQTMINTPDVLPAKSFVEGRSHSITMMLINVAIAIQKSISDPVLDQQIEKSIYEIETYFMHPEYSALMESVSPNGEIIDTCAGRTINPGHCIETAWFILEVARKKEWDSKLVNLAKTIFDWSWQWGWDEEFGGIINFKDCKGFPHQDYSQDMKFWWPQCETIIATLYLYLTTKEDKYLELHKMIHQYTFDKFPDSENGEWYGYLHRDGSVAQAAKGNIFKGPFHIPRMMIVAPRLCDEILAE